MHHEEAQHRAPEFSVLDPLPKSANGDLAGQILAAPESSRLAIAQGLRRGVMIGRLTNVMFHTASENQRQVQRANGHTSTEANEPGLLPKRVRSGLEIPYRVHEPWHRIMSQ